MFVLEIIGTVAFAVSGAMVAIEKKMDILGVMVLGLTTAVGGGILRDLFMGITPPMAFQQPVYALVAMGVSLLTFLPFFRRHINTNGFWFVLMDSIGLGVFAVVGVEMSQSMHNVFFTIMVSVINCVGGGVMRDLFACERPMIFVRHFYATAALIGTVVCTGLYYVLPQLAPFAGILVIVVLRLLAAKYRWHLPKA